MPPSCTICEDSGWLIEQKNGHEVAIRCSCSQQKIADTRAEQANLPPRFLGCLLQAFMAREDAPSLLKAKQIVSRFIRDYPAVDKGVLLHGPVGVGKTRLLCSIANELWRRFPELDIYYIDWNDLVRIMRTGEDAQSRDFGQIHTQLSRLSDCDILLFDELGASKISPWVMDNVYFVLNRRYNHQKITVSATNFFDQPGEGQESLTERIGERMRSRLHEMTQSIELFGVDYRRQYS